MSEEPVVYFLKVQDGAVRATKCQDNDNVSGQQGEKWLPSGVAKETSCIHNATEDNDDEYPLPAKRRRLFAESECIHVQSPMETSDASQSQAEHGRPPSPIGDERHSRKSWRRLPVAEYRKWAFTGFLKRTSIGDKITYNLEFALPPISEHLQLPIHSEVLRDPCKTSSKDTNSSKAWAYSRLPVSSSQSMKRVPWTEEEDRTVLEMTEHGCSWDEICAALRCRTKQMIQVRYSTKLKKKYRGRRRQIRWDGFRLEWLELCLFSWFL